MIKYKDFSNEVSNKFDDAVTSWLYEVAEEVKGQAQSNSRVDTGSLKASWQYKVDESKQEAVVGSPQQNAIWEEFGTGQYALEGNGRKTPWVYTDRQGVTHKTTGKKPNRTLYRAFEPFKDKFKRRLEQILKGGLS